MGDSSSEDRPGEELSSPDDKGSPPRDVSRDMAWEYLPFEEFLRQQAITPDEVAKASDRLYEDRSLRRSLLDEAEMSALGQLPPDKLVQHVKRLEDSRSQRIEQEKDNENRRAAEKSRLDDELKRQRDGFVIGVVLLAVVLLFCMLVVGFHPNASIQSLSMALISSIVTGLASYVSGKRIGESKKND